ncbi:retrotransposon hot spot (RHS) protein [Trypanosoma cruzi]|nr:retrotransposon hot spot (RHS) protein [Trypanosoma cruzi]
MDVNAMCAWITRDETKEKQAEYWKMVEKHMYLLGPIPRHIFDEGAFTERCGAVRFALQSINEVTVKEYFSRGSKLSYSEDPCHKIVKIVRARTDEGAEVFLNASICADIGSRTADCLAKAIGAKDILLLILGSRGALASRTLEQLGLRAFMYGELVSALVKGLNELRSPERDEAQDSVLKINHQGYPTRTVGLRKLEGGVTRISMEYGVLYIPAVQNFPLEDAFCFLVSNPMTLVGLRMATAGGRHTTASTVRQFTECLAAYFNGWEELSRDVSWEIIYVQHADNMPMTDWQRCDAVNANNLSEEEKEIAAFWNEKVRQYQVSIPSRDFRRDEALRSVQKKEKKTK